MHIQSGETARQLKQQILRADLVVIGGGLAGACCAVTAARAGVRTVLIHDRPVLGGNASSEVRLWVLGATAHLSNNNRWAREGGVVDELLVENMYRNPEGNPVVFDTVLLDKVVNEPNITLLLNTAVHEVEKTGDHTIRCVRGFCSQNSTAYEVHAPLFCDASGDGIVGFLAGAAFRMGAESADEFGEKFAPSREYGELLGHSIYFYSRDVGQPVRFVAPSYALKDVSGIARHRPVSLKLQGCQLWWIEYGGRLDTVHDTEQIKWELWRVAYGLWDYIKNSGLFPQASTYTLEWFGTIPGKRESRRFEGDYMLRQSDIVRQQNHADAVSYGGWSIDLHPADGVYSDRRQCNQWHSKGLYHIPYRCLYSRNITNLFLAGRIISASHVAFGSSRVMATCANSAQAVGLAAAHCIAAALRPRDLLATERITSLQQALIRTGQYIPQLPLRDDDDLSRQARISASSRFALAQLPAGEHRLKLQHHWAMMLPASNGRFPRLTLNVDVAHATELQCELRTSSVAGNHTPDVVRANRTIRLEPGEAQAVAVDFATDLDGDQYAFVCFAANPHVAVHLSDRRLTGVLALRHEFNPANANAGTQCPPQDIGVDEFEFWTPPRRPGGQNLAITLDPPIDAFSPDNVANGIARPTVRPNAWVADPADPQPSLTLEWDQPRQIGRIEISFDTDFDHPMESVLMGHPEHVMPFCIRRYRLVDADGKTILECSENHQTRNTIRLEAAITTRRLTLQVEHPSPDVPAAVFEIRCYR